MMEREIDGFGRGAGLPLLTASSARRDDGWARKGVRDKPWNHRKFDLTFMP